MKPLAEESGAPASGPASQPTGELRAGPEAGAPPTATFDLAAQLAPVARRWLPCLLTAVCRDPASPHHGCFDRDWWHYRIRDFPSIILQQGGYALHTAAQLQENAPSRDGLNTLAAAAGRFWNQRATRRGAFEEYYPWEQGYPPLAFATLAVMKLAAQGVVPPASVRAGAEVASRQLRRRFEAQAANQQVAGLAALAWCRKLFPELVPAAEFDALARRTLALQTDEGWFQEYGGPDLGYLSVTVDCLWDLWDAAGEQRFFDAIARAIECLDTFTAATPGTSLGMHNARNTDYIVPYGVVRAALELPSQSAPAVGLLQRLFAATDGPDHFLHAVDDRYVCHYVGHSVLRALGLLQTRSLPMAGEAARTNGEGRLTKSGHFLRAVPGDELIVTLRKGGIFTWSSATGRVSDFGWIIEAGGRQFITHWWSEDWRFQTEPARLTVAGAAYEHREAASGPFKHLALRALSFTLGQRVIGALKQRLIFAKPPSAIQFQRVLTWAEGSLEITDTFTGLPADARLTPAPRSSKRHVASADSYHREDLRPGSGFLMRRDFQVQPGTACVVTRYAPVHSQR